MVEKPDINYQNKNVLHEINICYLGIMNKSLIALGAQTARRFLSSSSKNTIGGGDANRADTGNFRFFD